MRKAPIGYFTLMFPWVGGNDLPLGTKLLCGMCVNFERKPNKDVNDYFSYWAKACDHFCYCSHVTSPCNVANPWRHLSASPSFFPRARWGFPFIFFTPRSEKRKSRKLKEYSVPSLLSRAARGHYRSSRSVCTIGKYGTTESYRQRDYK